ncbi:MAG: hypothetical protein KF817_13685 [Phycisphaeraceae bacterium]|nr:hypothetical protein [Phycisphaeraceae bacterium]
MTTDPGNPSTAKRRRLRSTILQAGGFLLGLALLAWCIHHALRPEDAEGWRRLREAPPIAIAGMVACSAISAAVNGFMFWISIRPIHRAPLRRFQAVNLAAGLLNYAPVRLGALVRMLYHIRVDRLPIVTVGGWFALLALLVGIAVGATAGATLLRPRLDPWWLLLLLGLAGAGLVAFRQVGHRLPIARVSRDVALLISHPGALPLALAARLVDLGAFTARLWIAILILDIGLAPSDAALLALVALVSGLVPFGRLGVREFCVALAADLLSRASEEIDRNMAQLALIDSAAEALFFIVPGGLALLWVRGQLFARSAQAPPASAV